MVELKHAISEFMAVTGGTSAELCSYLLKLVDFLDELVAGRNPARELRQLTATLRYSVIAGFMERYPGSITASQLQPLQARWQQTPADNRYLLDSDLGSGMQLILDHMKSSPQ